EAERVVPRGFFGGADLGPLLDKMEEAEKKIEKTIDKKGEGKATAEDVSRAKQEFQRAALRAAEAAVAYRKKSEMGSTTQSNSQEIRNALTKAKQKLLAEICTPIMHLRRKYQ